jgi:hypothetical protein
MADAARLPNYDPFAIGQERGHVTLADTPPGPEMLAEALGGVPLSSSTTLRLVVTSGHSTVTLRCSAPREPGPLVALGMDVHRLRCALSASGLLSSLISVEFDDDEDFPADHESVAIAIARPAE